jgi:hypothetical protein
MFLIKLFELIYATRKTIKNPIGRVQLPQGRVQPVSRIHHNLNTLWTSGCYLIFRNIAISEEQMQVII